MLILVIFSACDFPHGFSLWIKLLGGLDSTCLSKVPLDVAIIVFLLGELYSNIEGTLISFIKICA